MTITSIGVLIGNKISKTPNDKNHNYGHEKAETLVSFLLSIFLIGIWLNIGYSAFISLFNLGNIKTRKHGAMAYVYLTIFVNKDLSVYEGHEITNGVEYVILNKMSFIKGITIDVEPYINCTSEVII